MYQTLSFLTVIDSIIFRAGEVLFKAGVYFVYLAPFFLVIVLWEVYLLYIRSNYIKNEPRILLEVKIPKEISKSPKAMEMLLEVFHQTYEGELIDKYIKGSIRGWFSLELVSLGGRIHFYFQIPKFFKNLVESRIYSQYPEVEISEADDYTKEIAYGQSGSPWDIKVFEYSLNQPDPYPIKTYVDYEMEKDPKEEFKIDPMTPLLEHLASIKPNERVAIQIMIMAAKKRFANPKTGEREDWTKEGKRLLDKLLKREEAKGEDLSKVWVKMNLSPGEKAVVESIERNLTKLGFDVGLRAFYSSTEELRPIVNVGINTSLKQFGSDKLNSFKPSHKTGFDNPWQDPFGWRTRRLKSKHFKYFCLRSYFYPPASKQPITLTTEELATIYHFPGQVATTPTLARIPSKRGEPPENLPI